MTPVVEPTYRSPDSDLAAQVAKLWPHRECEANIVLGQLCRIGLHWWRRLGRCARGGVTLLNVAIAWATNSRPFCDFLLSQVGGLSGSFESFAYADEQEV